jgi:hypothetical protein
MAGARKAAPKYVVVIMDGTSSLAKETLKEATKLKTRYGAEIFCVGIALPNTKEAYDIATSPAKDHVTLIKQFDLMKLHAVDVATKLCQSVNNPKPGKNKTSFKYRRSLSLR